MSSNALQAFLPACYPQVKVMHLKLWQARVIARLTGRMDSAGRLIGYFDRVGELGDPAEADVLLGAASTPFSEWLESQKAAVAGPRANGPGGFGSGWRTGNVRSSVWGGRLLLGSPRNGRKRKVAQLGSLTDFPTSPG